MRLGFRIDALNGLSWCIAGILFMKNTMNSGCYYIYDDNENRINCGYCDDGNGTMDDVTNYTVRKNIII